MHCFRINAYTNLRLTAVLIGFAVKRNIFAVKRNIGPSNLLRSAGGTALHQPHEFERCLTRAHKHGEFTELNENAVMPRP